MESRGLQGRRNLEGAKLHNSENHSNIEKINVFFVGNMLFCVKTHRGLQRLPTLDRVFVKMAEMQEIPWDTLTVAAIGSTIS